MHPTVCDPEPRAPLGVQLDELTTHLNCRLGGRVRELRLDLRGHGLVLQGSASTYYVKQLAQHALMRLAALPVVANEIAVS